MADVILHPQVAVRRVLNAKIEVPGATFTRGPQTVMSAARIIQAIRAILFAGLAATTVAHAATTPAPAPAPSVTDTCLMCHADKDAKGAAGKSIAVDGAKFAASVHGEMKLKC